MEIPDDLDEYDSVEADVKFYCPKCKCEVPKEDAFVVVFGCSINMAERRVVQIPQRAFHINPFKKTGCREDLDIQE